MDMSKRLRRKFIAVAMASVAMVLVGIVAAINVANYFDVCNQADARLALIQQNGGAISDNAVADAASGGSTDEAAAASNADDGSSPNDSSASPAGSGQKPKPAGDSSQPTEDPGSKDASAGDPKADGEAPNAALPRGNAAEMVFEMRYFTVCLNADGSVSSVNVDKIAAVSADQAAEMAQGMSAGASRFLRRIPLFCRAAR